MNEKSHTLERKSLQLGEKGERAFQDIDACAIQLVVTATGASYIESNRKTGQHLVFQVQSRRDGSRDMLAIDLQNRFHRKRVGEQVLAGTLHQK